MEIATEDRKRLEDMGELYGLPSPLGISAVDWLAEKAEAQRMKDEVRQAALERANKSAVINAWMAALAGSGAIAVAILARLFSLH